MLHPCYFDLTVSNVAGYHHGMKTSTNIARVMILAPVLIFVMLLMLLALFSFLESKWGFPYDLIAPIVGLMIFPLVLIFIVGCISYAVVVLRESWRAWTGYLSASRTHLGTFGSVLKVPMVPFVPNVPQ